MLSYYGRHHPFLASRNLRERHQYSTNNKIVKIQKMLAKPIVVISDDIGTIRLYNYPNVKGEPYYQSYGDHLFRITDCVFSSDRTYLLSCCEYSVAFMTKVK